jgi:hypothetical protein
MKFIIAFALLQLPLPAFGCLCLGNQTVERAYRESTAVFAGRLIVAEYQP